MTERVWDRFLTDQDRSRAAAVPAIRKGAGTRPVLLLVDLYRWVFGDEPLPLLEALPFWPGSCGLNGWRALPHIQRLLGTARELRVPVVHVTGFEGMPGWHDRRPGADEDAAMLERRRRRYDIVDELAPILGEVVLRKSAPSAFWGTPMAGLLTGFHADTIVVAGESTSGCVRATVVDGKSHRFKVIVPEECVFDRDEAPHALSLFTMDQKYADVIALDETMQYLRAAAGASAPAG